ncbi:phage tail tape measure protein [Pseudomonas abietaniphila]
MASRSLGTLTLDLIAKIGGFQQGMNQASQAVAKTGAAADAASSRVAALEAEFLSLSSVASKIAGPLTAAFSVGAIYTATEAYSTLTNRLKLVTNGSAELAAAQSAVFGIAQDARQPLTATAELYQRIATNQNALKLSGEGVAGVVSTISKTLAISGASAESANAALIQLGQAFASGVLRGEELNSVLEQAPALAQAIANGMGKTVGDLRNLGAQGLLTADAVVKALQNQSGAVDSLFSKMTATIGGSVTVIGNSITRFVGEIDQMTGASGKVAAEILSAAKVIDGSLPAALDGIRAHSEGLTQAFTTGLYIALSRVAGGFAQQGAAAIAAAAANQTALSAAAALAKQDLQSAQAKQVDARAIVERANLEVAAAQSKVGADRARQASELSNIQSVQAALAAELTLEQERLKAQINEQGRAASLARIAEIRLAQVAVIKQVENAERSLAATTVASSAVVEKAYAGRAAATLALGETTAAVNALSVASNNAAAAASVTGRALGSLATAGRGALALFGGPVGLVFVAAAAALSFVDFRSSADKAAEGLEGLKGPLDDVIAKFKTLTQDQKAAALIKWGEAEAESIKAAGEEYSKLQGMLKTGLVGPRSSASGSSAFQDYSKQLDDAAASGKALSPILDQLRNDARVPSSVADSLIKQAGAYSTVKGQADQARERLNALNGEMNKGVGISASNTQATAGMSTAGEQYLKTLQDQLGKLQDNNDAVKEATRYIEQHKNLTEADKAAILSTAYATRAQADANKESASELRKNSAEIKSNQKVFETAQENYKRQIELLNTTADRQQNATEVEKLAFEVASGKYESLSEQRKKELQGLAAELDAKKKLKQADEDRVKLLAFTANLNQEGQTAKDGNDLELAGLGRGDKYRERLKQTLGIQQDFNKKMSDLQEQQNTGKISKSLYDDETEQLQEALADRLVSQQDYYNQLDIAQSDWMTGVDSAWENYADAAKNYSQTAADLTTGALNDASSSLSGFFSDVATGSKTAGDALIDMVSGFAESTLKALSDMAAQWLVYQAVQLVVGKSTQAVSNVALVANAQATSFQAQLAAFASTAAIPIVGPALAPGAALAAAAATAPMVAGVASASIAGMAHSGMENIPKEGTWLLDGGERVVAPAQNRDLTNFLAKQTAGPESGGIGGQHIEFHAPVTVEAQPGVSDDDARRQGGVISDAIEQRMGQFLDREMRQGGRLWRRNG